MKSGLVATFNALAPVEDLADRLTVLADIDEAVRDCFLMDIGVANNLRSKSARNAAREEAFNDFNDGLLRVLDEARAMLRTVRGKNGAASYLTAFLDDRIGAVCRSREYFADVAVRPGYRINATDECSYGAESLQ